MGSQELKVSQTSPHPTVTEHTTFHKKTSIYTEQEITLQDEDKKLDKDIKSNILLILNNHEKINGPSKLPPPLIESKKQNTKSTPNFFGYNKNEFTEYMTYLKTDNYKDK